ncbi:MAG: hypothetical protein GY869_06770, partial [Planctomycetes bacterium]|nr:hypothetical protein [Planctomycetota bacterium]
LESSVLVYVQYPADSTTAGPQAVEYDAGLVDEFGQFSIGVTLNQGYNDIFARAIDQVGNQSIYSLVEYVRVSNLAVDNLTADPDPFSPQDGNGFLDVIALGYDISQDADVVVEILDLDNTVIDTVFNGEQFNLLNPQIVIWDGRDMGGSFVSQDTTGIYIFRVWASQLGTAAVTNEFNFLVDNEPPDSVALQLPIEAIISQTPYDLTGRLFTNFLPEPNATAEVWIDNDSLFIGQPAGGVDFSPPVSQGIQVTDANGLFTISIDLATGANYIFVQMTDEVYNVAPIPPLANGVISLSDMNIEILDLSPNLNASTPPTFSPNADGFYDLSTLTFDISNNAIVQARILAGDINQTLVYDISLDTLNVAANPHQVQWDGQVSNLAFEETNPSYCYTLPDSTASSDPGSYIFQIEAQEIIGQDNGNLILGDIAFATALIIVDNIPPDSSLIVLQQIPTPTTETPANLRGVSEPRSTARLYVDNGLGFLFQNETEADDLSGEFEIDVDLQPGNNFIYVMAVDDVMNVCGISEIDTVFMSELFISDDEAAPNPFSPNDDNILETTTIAYTISQDAEVGLEIFRADDLENAFYTVPAEQRFAALPNSFIWDGADPLRVEPYDDAYAYIYRLTATDIGGAIAVASGNIVADVLPPEPPIITSYPSQSSTSPVDIIGITLEPGLEVTVWVDDDSLYDEPLDPTPPVRQEPVNSDDISGIWEMTVGLTNGYNYLFTQAKDAVEIPSEISGQNPANETYEIFLSDVNISNLTAAPNPFSPNDDLIADVSNINFTISRGGNVTLNVYDPSGQNIIDTFFDEPLASGDRSIPWDGMDPANPGDAFPDQVYPVEVVINDNGIIASDRVNVEIDNTEPDRPIITIPDEDISVTTPTVTIGGIAEGGSLVDIYLDTDLSDGVPAMLVAADVPADQNLNFFQSEITLQPGFNYIWAIATDEVGNVSLPSTPPREIFLSDLFIANHMATPNPFSPDGNEINDFTVITYDLSDEATVEVQIWNSSDEIQLYTITPDPSVQFPSDNPNSVVWHGDIDPAYIGSQFDVDSNGIADDMLYVFRIIAVREGLVAQVSDQVRVDLTAPDAPILTPPESPASTSPIIIEGSTQEPGIAVRVWVEHQVYADGQINFTPDGLVRGFLQGEVQSDPTTGYFSMSVEIEEGDNDIYALAIDDQGLESPYSDVETVFLTTLNVTDPNASPDPFSPNGDNFLDRTFISYNISKDARVAVFVQGDVSDTLWSYYGWNDPGLYHRPGDSLQFSAENPNSVPWTGAINNPGFYGSAFYDADNNHIVDDGVYTYYIFATDPNPGGEGTSAYASGEVIVDLTPPDTLILSQPDSVSDTESIEVTGVVIEPGGTPEVGAEVIMFVESESYANGVIDGVGVAYGPYESLADGTVTGSVTLLPGDNDIYAMATDIVGNESGYSNLVISYLRDLRLENLAVNPPVFSPNGDFRLDITIISYDLSQDATVMIEVMTLDNVPQDTILAATAQYLSQNPQQISYDGYVNDVVLDDGVYRLRVTAWEDEGNPVVEEIDFEIDTTPPDGPIISVPEPNFVTSQATIDVIGNAQPGCMVEIFVDDDDFFDYPNGSDITPPISQGEFTTDASTGIFSGSATLRQGDNWLFARATDPYFNETEIADMEPGVPVILSEVYVDILSIAPSPFSPNGDYYLDLSTLTFEVSHNSNVTVNVRDEAGDLVITLRDEVFMNSALNPHQVVWNGDSTACNPPTPQCVYFFEIIAVQVTDDGNTGLTATAEGPVIIDNMPPDPPIISDLADVYSSLPISVTGSAEPGASVTIYVDDDPVGILDEPGDYTPPIAQGDVAVDEFTGQFVNNGVTLSAGYNYIFGTTTDPYGNTSVESTPVQQVFLTDLYISILSIQPNPFAPGNGDNFLEFTSINFNISQDCSIQVEIFDETGNTLLKTFPYRQLYEDNNPNRQIWDGTDNYDDIVGHGFYRVAITAMISIEDDGLVTAVAHASVNIDLEPPPQPILNELASYVSSSPINVVGSAEQGSFVEVLVENPGDSIPGNSTVVSVALDQANDITGIFSMNTVIGEGFNDIYAQATDAYGNSSPIVPGLTQVEVVFLSEHNVTMPTAIPNPFSPNGDNYTDFTLIGYELSNDANVTIDILTPNGLLVIRLVDDQPRYEVSNPNLERWDGDVAVSGGPGDSDNNGYADDGHYRARITARVGELEAYADIAIVVDLTPPLPPELYVIPNPQTQTPIRVRGQSETGATIDLYVENPADGEVGGATPFLYEDVATDEIGRFLIDAVELYEGDNDIYAYARDAVGNLSQPSVVQTIFLSELHVEGMSIAPNPFSPNGDFITDQTFVTYSLSNVEGVVQLMVTLQVRTLDANAQIIYTQGPVPQLPDEENQMVWDGSVDIEGSWDLDENGYADDNVYLIEIIAQATSGEGITVTSIGQATVRVDLTAPEAPILIDVPRGTTADPLTVHGFSEPGTTIELYVEAPGDSIATGQAVYMQIPDGET